MYCIQDPLIQYQYKPVLCIYTCMFITDAKTAEEAIRSIFVLLTDGMPANSLIPALTAKGVITPREQGIMKLPKRTSTQNTVYLLNEIVIPSLKIGDLQKFEKLLQAMEESEDLTCQSLATELNSRIKISRTKITPPFGN